MPYSRRSHEFGVERSGDTRFGDLDIWLEIWIFGWRFGQISGQTENYVGGFVKNALFFL